MPKKHILDIDEETWKKVLKYKIDATLPNNNETVIKLIKKGLESDDSS
ncbi:MAG: hypothetical protein ABJB76_04030 [Candidatus Nitrosocosmicus sp.]